jgi:hypothetical protein
MRTKTLLIAVAALAAGLASSMAQAVYSQNVVGYVNLPTTAGGYKIAANPLNTTNNDVQYIFQNPPAGLTIFKRNNAGTGYDQSTFDPDIPGWTAPLVVNPGDGIWITSPVNYTNTFVGEVLQGNLTNAVPAGYSLKSSQVPQSAGVATAMNYPIGNGDTFFFWNGVGYDQTTYDPDIPGWTAGEPTPSVAQGFWINNPNASKNWTRSFTVN